VPYIIGTDEAGYGPNLGPLVVAATVWEVPLGVRAEDLYERLGPAVCPNTKPPEAQSAEPLVICDSKQAYQSGQGLKHLERGVWAALRAMDQMPRCWSELWETLAPDCLEAMFSEPWYSEFDSPLPIELQRAEADRLGRRFHQALADADMELLDVVCRPVFPKEFNKLLTCFRSKTKLLSNVTLQLVHRVVQRLGGQPVSIVCDKHGGRNRYLPLLNGFFSDCPVEVRHESRQQSVYRFKLAGDRVEVRFCMRAESYLPVALASMFAKYLRELAMMAWNEFWCDRLPGLEPTAGYPNDARRFKEAIADAQAELQIDDCLIWRNK